MTSLIGETLAQWRRAAFEDDVDPATRGREGFGRAPLAPR
jgi:hypothetical protein